MECNEQQEPRAGDSALCDATRSMYKSHGELDKSGQCSMSLSLNGRFLLKAMFWYHFLSWGTISFELWKQFQLTMTLSTALCLDIDGLGVSPIYLETPGCLTLVLVLVVNLV
eukprot:m.203700 g.203700  ORF g.203700 m.203700 type:complete len:112 (+) comp14993_c0_seq2:791-1126(+)